MHRRDHQGDYRVGRRPRAGHRAILVIQKWAEEEGPVIEKQNKSSKK